MSLTASLDLLYRQFAAYRSPDIVWSVSSGARTLRTGHARNAAAAWAQLLVAYPLELGYLSDSASALDLLDWCALPLTSHLDSLLTAATLPATRHLADLVDAVFTNRKPFESASKATVLDLVKVPAVGEALQSAFFDEDSEDAAQQLSRVHELWTTCARS